MVLTLERHQCWMLSRVQVESSKETLSLIIFSSGGKGTFFINCLRVCVCEFDLPAVYYEKGNCSSNQAALLRMVREGHVLGDHSSDHMAHNHIGKVNTGLSLVNILNTLVYWSIF